MSNSRNKVLKQHFAGYDFTNGPKGMTIDRETIDTDTQGDYGCDPLGDGRFRMVPSGEIVDFEERNRRLGSRSRPNPGTSHPA